METSNRLLLMVFSAIMFCIGIFLLMYEAIQYREALSNVRDSYKEQVLYEQYNMSKSEVISHANLTASLFYTLEYDIKIDELIIKKEEYDLYNIDDYGIREIDYQKEYRYDENGIISMVIYTGLG